MDGFSTHRARSTRLKNKNKSQKVPMRGSWPIISKGRFAMRSFNRSKVLLYQSKGFLKELFLSDTEMMDAKSSNIPLLPLFIQFLQLSLSYLPLTTKAQVMNLSVCKLGQNESGLFTEQTNASPHSPNIKASLVKTPEDHATTDWVRQNTHVTS